jgi:hypothetical protein
MADDLTKLAEILNAHRFTRPEAEALLKLFETHSSNPDAHGVTNNGDETVPFFVPAGQRYRVDANKQALWKIPISLGAGASLEIYGALEQVT